METQDIEKLSTLLAEFSSDYYSFDTPQAIVEVKEYIDSEFNNQHKEDD